MSTLTVRWWLRLHGSRLLDRLGLVYLAVRWWIRWQPRTWPETLAWMDWVDARVAARRNWRGVV